MGDNKRYERFAPLVEAQERLEVVCMTPSQGNCSYAAVKYRLLEGGWLGVEQARHDVFLHAVFSIFICLIELNYLIPEWYAWLRVPMGIAVCGAGEFGWLPFFLSSPIVSFVMVFVL